MDQHPVSGSIVLSHQFPLCFGRQIFDDLKRTGKILIDVDPTETVVGNMIKRILKLIRDEYNHFKGCNEGTEGFQVFRVSSNAPEFDVEVDMDKLKDAIIIGIGELLSELENSGGNIAQQALEHIYSDEVIMTIGRSKTVESFLKYAAKKRKFQVIIAECAPTNNVNDVFGFLVHSLIIGNLFQGHEFAVSLAKENINTILIPDSAIFSVMSRVNKVIIGTHSIMANGGSVCITVRLYSNSFYL